MKYKLYMFDFDLTMADSVEASVMSYAAAYAVMGLKFDRNEIYRHLGMSTEHTYSEISGGKCDSDGYKKFLDAFHLSLKNNFHTVTLYPDVIGAFERINDSGALVAVVTHRRTNSMQTMYDKYPELKRLVAATITSDDTDKRKPLPDPLLICLERLGVSKRDAVYFGDAKNDFLSATAAGVDFCYVDRTGFVNESGAIESFDEIE